MNSRTSAVAAAFVVAALGLAGCGAGSSHTTTAGGAVAAATGGPLDLRGTCPDRIVIQTDWEPQSERGAIYHLVGPGAEIDRTRKRVVGPLVAAGHDTGIKIEIRAGGPAIGFQQVSAQMYLDKGITLGEVNTDEAAQLSASQPTTAVVAPLEINPQTVMWDPKRHPSWSTIADIGQTDTTVLYYKGATYMEYLVGSGILRRTQLDGSFDGTPARFIASRGTIAQQGFATNDGYLYEREFRQWGKPIQYALIHDTGYPTYSQTLSVRAGRKAELAACLRKLVPVVQRSAVEYYNDPEATNELIVRIVKEYADNWTYSEGHADWATQQMKRIGIMGNGPDRTVGNFDRARVQKIIDIVTPIFAGQRKPVKPNLSPDDLATNEFIDPSVGLG